MGCPEENANQYRRLILKAGSLLGLGLFGLNSKVGAAEKKPISRIAFGSCAFQWVEQPIWNGVNATRPDLFLFLGDAIYGDWHGGKPFVPTQESLFKDWQLLETKSGFKELRQRAPVLATWEITTMARTTAELSFRSRI